MVWTQRFCFCFPIRLGVIATTASSVVAAGFAILIYSVYEPDISGAVLQLYKDEEGTHDRSFFVEFVLTNLKKYPEAFGYIIIASIGVYMLAGILAIFGSVKLLKWFLFPYIVVDFIRLAAFFTAHILLMLLLKKKFDLGVLILASVTGGFVILFLGYLWATVVALYQIIGVTQTTKYKMMYELRNQCEVHNQTDNSSISTEDLIWISKENSDPLQSGVTPFQRNKSFQFWYINELPNTKKTRLIMFD